MLKYCINTVILLLSFLFIPACDDEYQSAIPSREVNLKLDLNNTDYALTASLATKVFIAKRYETDRLGYGGILVINGLGEQSHINLFAFDLSCPEEVNPDIHVVPDDTGLAVCEKCGAIFNIAYGNGNPEKGSKRYLRSYRVTKTGDNTYVVTN